ncbi:MAG: CsgG/HfaB family protein, partial [Brevinematales bacterium]
MQRIITVLIAIFIISAAFGWESSTRIAVLGIDSRVKGEDVDTAGFSEIIQNTLVNRKVYIIVERAQLYKILEEQKLQASGIAENEASRIGSIAGANKVIIGSLVRIDREYQLLIKVIDSSTGAIEISQEIKGGSIGDIADNIPAAVDMIIKKSGGEENTDSSDAAAGAPSNTIHKPGFFPVQVSFFRGVALVPESFTITGAGFDLIMGYDYA